MSENNNTKKVRKNQYHHLTKEDRLKIESLASQKNANGKRLFSNTYIANYLGVHKSTVSRELRNRKEERMYIRTGKTKTMPYSAEYAQQDADFKRGLSKGEYKLRKNKILAKFIEDKIKIDKWAPDAIVGYMKVHNYFERNGFESITTPTIYNAIRYHIINVKLEDTRRMKYKPEYKYHKIFKSFTTDNGTEFSDFLNIIKDTKAKIYFCHPYCSGEKGTNEKHNGIIRYFIPKGSLIENYSYKDINKIVEWMNNYPRKILNYKTPLEVLQEEFNDKAILNKIYKLQEKINCL